MPSVRQYDNKVQIRFPVAEEEVSITVAEYNLIKTTFQRVHSVKFLREQYGLDLKTAVRLFDTIIEVPLANIS